MKIVRSRAGAVIAGLFLIAASLVLAVPPTAYAAVDLLSEFDYRVDGPLASDFAGSSVDGAGDVNGDGTPDLIVGVPGRDLPSKSGAGQAYVIFGTPPSSTLDLGLFANEGFRIDGAALNDLTGTSVAGVGDVNGDDLDDVAVSSFAGTRGAVYVVFGKTTTTTVDLASLGTAGFKINGAAVGDQLATNQSLGGAGDVNGDGLQDIVTGALFADNNSRTDSGSAYVVFGKETTTTVELATLGTAGFRIDGADGGDWAGFHVAGGTDVNDDGKDDVIVGAPESGTDPRIRSGSAYVVFGKDTTTNIDLASLGDGGFRIDGAVAYDTAGTSVGTAADVNGDGNGDLIVGAPADSTPNAGSAFVVFGKDTTTTVDLASLGTGGFRIDGAAGDDTAGAAVAGAGDANDDGLTDVIVGAPKADNNSRDASGSAYVVYGKASTTTVDLASLVSEGFSIDGAEADDETGNSVAGVGDIDDDGLDDVIVGARDADFNSRDNSGSAYLELVDWLPGACANVRSGTDGDDTLTGGEAGDDITGGEGNDTLEGEDGDDCIDGEAGEDTVEGGDDNDELTGGSNADTVKGQDGEDTLDGGGGADDLEGGQGVDTVEGGENGDDIDGGSGADTLKGEEGQDTIEGAGGADTLKGWTEGDTLKGEGGADTLEGYDGQDTLKGGTEGDTIKGEGGADTLKGEDGKDTLKGGDENDTIFGGDGKDTIESGGGDDVIEADDGEKDEIDCGGGNDDVDSDNKDVLTSC